MRGFKITISTVSIDVRIVNVFVFILIWLRWSNIQALGHRVIFSGNLTNWEQFSCVCPVMNLFITLCGIVGVSIKDGYWRSPPPVEPLTAVCLGFINENKNDNKKSKFNKNDDHWNFSMLQIQHAFWGPERWKSHFRASRFQIFQGGGMPPDPPKGKGALQPL